MRRRDQKGVILGWVVILLTVVTLITGAALAASFGYYNYVLTRSRRQQAVYTAQSAAEVIAESLSRKPDADNPVAVMLQAYPGTVIEIEGLDEAMGTCTVVSDYDEAGNLRITVTADVGGNVQSVTAGFRPVGDETSEQESGDTYRRWELTAYEAGEEHEQNP